MTVYALNLFDVADRDEYLAYSKRSPAEVAKHGGRVVALGKFRESMTGDIEPRTVLILVEWDSKEAFDSYCNDPSWPTCTPTARTGRRPTSGTCSIAWTTCVPCLSSSDGS